MEKQKAWWPSTVAIAADEAWRMERRETGRRHEPSFAPSFIVFCYSHPGPAHSDAITHPVLSVNVTEGMGGKNAHIYSHMHTHTHI